MKHKHKKKKHLSREQRRKRWIAFLSIICIIIFCLVIAYQAVSDILNKNIEERVNFYGLRIDPALQLMGLFTLIIVVIIFVLQKLFRKEKPASKKKSKHKYEDFQYPHERIPF